MLGVKFNIHGIIITKNKFSSKRELFHATRRTPDAPIEGRNSILSNQGGKHFL
jgi:hypothetical protein